MTAPIRIAVADDHALFRQGLRSMLHLRPEVAVVVEVERAADVIPAVHRTTCDILLLDLQMERSSLSEIAMLAEMVKVIVVTATERVEDALAAMSAGARGIVFKRFAIETLMTAIHAVTEGHVWMPPELQAAVTAQRSVPSMVALTRREREIVRYVALGHRNPEIATRLDISDVTVKTHLNNVLKKLGLRDRVDLTLYAIRNGIIGVHERRF